MRQEEHLEYYAKTFPSHPSRVATRADMLAAFALMLLALGALIVVALVVHGCAFPAEQVRQASGLMATDFGVYAEYTTPAGPDVEAARLQVAAGLAFFEIAEDGPHPREAEALAAAWATYRDGAPPRAGLTDEEAADVAALRAALDANFRRIVEVER